MFHDLTPATCDRGCTQQQPALCHAALAGSSRSYAATATVAQCGSRCASSVSLWYMVRLAARLSAAIHQRHSNAPNCACAVTATTSVTYATLLMLCRFERAHYPDGRRCSRWYLVDQHGDRHLAVIGIERDTKDGHYNYIAVSFPPSLPPLGLCDLNAQSLLLGPLTQLLPYRASRLLVVGHGWGLVGVGTGPYEY